MRIAYIISRFPLISETFILREMIEIEKLGHEITVYPIICQDQPVVHEEARGWSSRVTCIPFLSREVFAANLRAFFGAPILYIELFLRVILENLPSLDFLAKGVYLFPKAVYTARVVQAGETDHIHAHYATHPGLEAWIIHRLTGISYSITIHSHDIYDEHAMLKTKLEGATFLALISNFNIDYISKLLGDHLRTKCHIIRCGVDEGAYQPVSKSPGETLELLQIGSLHWKKGQLFLVQAMALLKNKNLRFRLRIIGEGGERAKIEAEIGRLGLDGEIELLGAKTQREVAQILPTADCYIQSSVSEGIPVALMEALACELPVIATNITGIPELVMDSKTGYLVPPADPAALAHAVMKVREDPDEAARMGINGRLWVIEEFNLKKNAEKLSDLIEKTCIISNRLTHAS